MNNREQFLKSVTPFANKDGLVWIAEKTDKYHRAYLLNVNTGDGYATKKSDDDKRILTHKISDLHGYLEKRGNPILFLPAIADSNNWKGENIKAYPALSLEFDDRPIEEQHQFIEDLKKCGIYPFQIIHSGNKSLHVYFKLKEPITDSERFVQLQSLFQPFGVDKATAKTRQVMRAAGFLRPDTGKYQEVVESSDNSYTEAEIIEGITKLANQRGIDLTPVPTTSKKPSKRIPNNGKVISFATNSNDLRVVTPFLIEKGIVKLGENSKDWWNIPDPTVGDHQSLTAVGINKRTGRINVFNDSDPSVVHDKLLELANNEGYSDVADEYYQRYLLETYDKFMPKYDQVLLKRYLTTEDRKYHPEMILPTLGIWHIVALCGMGKTEFIDKMVNEWKDSVFVATPRQTLNKQYSTKHTDFCNVSDKNPNGNYDNFVACIESLDKLVPYVKSAKKPLVIFDEFACVLNSLLESDTCKEKRAVLLESLREILQLVHEKEGLFICADANIDQTMRDTIESLAPPEMPRFATLVKPPENSNYPKRDVTFFDDKPHFHQQLENNIRAGKKIGVYCSSKKKAKAIRERYINDEYLKEDQIVIVTSDQTKSKSSAYQAFIADPNKYIEDNNIKLVIYTSAMGVGISIDLRDYFDAVFCVDVNDPLDGIQGASRIRDNCPWFISCKRRVDASKPQSLMTSVHDISKNLFDNQLLEFVNLNATVNEEGEIVEYQSDINIATKLFIPKFAQFQLLKNFCRRDPEAILKHILKTQYGYNIYDFTLADDFILSAVPADQKIAQTQKLLEQEDIERIVNAEPVDTQNFEWLKEKRKRKDDFFKWHEKDDARLQKAFIQLTVGHCELTDEILHYAAKDLTRFFQQVRNYSDLHNTSKLRKQTEWENPPGDFEGIVALWDKSYNFNKIMLLKELDILGFLENLRNVNVTADSDNVESFFKRVLQFKTKVKTVFNINVRDDSSRIKLLNRLLGQVGYELKRQKVKGTLVYNLTDLLPQREAIMEGRSLAQQENAQPILDWAYDLYLEEEMNKISIKVEEYKDIIIPFLTDINNYYEHSEVVRGERCWVDKVLDNALSLLGGADHFVRWMVISTERCDPLRNLLKVLSHKGFSPNRYFNKQPDHQEVLEMITQPFSKLMEGFLFNDSLEDLSLFGT